MKRISFSGNNVKVSDCVLKVFSYHFVSKFWLKQLEVYYSEFSRIKKNADIINLLFLSKYTD